MRNTITYRHWQPGDDDAVLELLLPAEQCTEDYYRRKFENSSCEPEGVRLAFVNDRVVGHVFGSWILLFLDDKPQYFGSVTLVYVDSDMRRQGIATRLMQELNAYFESKNYRGALLDTDTEAAYQLYRKVGYQEVTRELETQISPRQDPSLLIWTEVTAEDFDTLHQIRNKWASQNFPVFWNPQHPVVHLSNMKQYRVLRREDNIVGYAKWDEPSKHLPHGLILDPVVPDEDPMEVITSLQSAFSAPRPWKTTVGSRYENLLCSLGYTLEPTGWVEMILSFDPQIDWSGLERTRPFW